MNAADYRKLILAFRDFLTHGIVERISPEGTTYARVNIDKLADCLERLERERDEQRAEGHAATAGGVY